MADHQTPRKCARGCGFFEQPENNFLCSKCYNDYLREEIVKSVTAATTITSTCTSPPPPPQGSTTNPFPWVNCCGVTPTTKSVTDSTVAAEKSNRCLCCKKKVGLMGFGCRCGGVFCGLHRYPEEHACKFDFKAMGRRILAKENILIVADKLPERI